MWSLVVSLEAPSSERSVDLPSCLVLGAWCLVLPVVTR